MQQVNEQLGRKDFLPFAIAVFWIIITGLSILHIDGWRLASFEFNVAAFS